MSDKIFKILLYREKNRDSFKLKECQLPWFKNHWRNKSSIITPKIENEITAGINLDRYCVFTISED